MHSFWLAVALNFCRKVAVQLHEDTNRAFRYHLKIEDLERVYVLIINIK